MEHNENMWSRLRKIVLAIIGVLVFFIIAVVVIASFVYPREYVYRVLAWNFSDVDDYRYNFPQSQLVASSEPTIFDVALDEEVSTVFEQQPYIDDFETFLTESDTQAFIVLRDGVVVYEQYFNDTERDTPVTSFSVAKSFTSALIGIAIDEGYINSVDDPITDYLPELAERDSRFEGITIRHVLLMASGLEYEEMRPFLFNGDDPLTTYHPNQRELALENTHIIAPPQIYFQYNKYHPQLLGMILERSTGVSVTEYTQIKLWKPLGMEFDGGWSLDSEDSGFEKMEAGLNGRAIDFAKFGQLFLNNGEWNGEQVISAGWVAESTQVEPELQNTDYYAHSFGPYVYDDGQGYYKYMWYGFFREDGGYDFAGIGDRGQYIYVSPYKNIVIVRHGYNFGLRDAFGWTDLFYDFVSEYE